ncbi:hypothetical protein [Egicoccus sp. AB-alg2]|uniref:hypothetical protein n=1 Tax=Egicoccus sp. AB-alg2 TaxID=3242693 RepID=UPI00359DF616
MSAGEHVTATSDAAVDDPARCVACGVALPGFGCCSFACVRAARRELERNVLQLRRLQSRDGPAETRHRLVARNGRLTAALLTWRH